MLSEHPSEGKKNFPEFILYFDVQRLTIYQKKCKFALKLIETCLEFYSTILESWLPNFNLLCFH